MAVIVLTTLSSLLGVGFLGSLLAAVWRRTRFDGIAVDVVPGMEGAFGLYSDSVQGFHTRIKVVNVDASSAAIEWIAAFLPLKPNPGAPPVHAAFGECWPELVSDGARGAHLAEALYPIVVAGNGGEAFMELTVAMQYYSRRLPFWPYFWKDLATVGIDDGAEAPTDPEGNRLYHDYFDVDLPLLRLRINGKFRPLAMRTRGWVGVLPRARLPGIMAARTTIPPVPLPSRKDNNP